jgi:hypothetical protein
VRIIEAEACACGVQGVPDYKKIFWAISPYFIL